MQKIKKLVEEWISQQGHNSCWYYPEIFDKICQELGVPIPDRGLPPEKEFEGGCERYRKELYVPIQSSHDADSRH